VYKSKIRQRFQEVKEVSQLQSNTISHDGGQTGEIMEPEGHENENCVKVSHSDSKQPATTPLLEVPNIVRGQILNKPWKSPFDKATSEVQTWSAVHDIASFFHPLLKTLRTGNASE
jgi:hypothetical protein